MVPNPGQGADREPNVGGVRKRQTRRRGRRVPKIPLRVLVIEDSVDDALLVAIELERGGYEPYYERVETPEAMRETLDEGRWDLVVSDHEMPRFSAPAALEILLEKRPDLPFIIVSGDIGEETALAAIRAGAYACVVKSNLARLCPAVEKGLHEAGKRRRSDAAPE